MNNFDVVIVGGTANGLGILRSLAPFSRCLVLADNKSLPVFHSRFGNKRLVKSTKKESIIEELERLGPSFLEPPLLFLSEEKTVEQVSLHRERLTKFYRFSMVNHQMIVDLQSKSGFQTLAEKYQAPIPKACVIQDLNGFKLADNLTFPCVFKPLHQDSAYSKSFKKAYKVAHLDEVKALYKDIQPVMADMILQEWLHGKDSDIFFCLAYFDEKSELVDAFSGRKIRSWPLNIGGTASCTNAPEVSLALKEITTQFAKNIAYKGLLGMEFKYDNQRGGFYMIEPTVARTDYQHEISTLSGHNLLLQIYLHTKKLNVPLFPLAQSSTIWRDEIADANALAHGGDAKEPKPARSFCAVKRWTDPLPYLNTLLKRITSRF